MRPQKHGLTRSRARRQVAKRRDGPRRSPVTLGAGGAEQRSVRVLVGMACVALSGSLPEGDGYRPARRRRGVGRRLACSDQLGRAVADAYSGVRRAPEPSAL